MKLCIKEIFWGIDRRNGGYSKRVTAQVEFSCNEGPLPGFGLGRSDFRIDKVDDNYIVLSIHYKNNSKADKKWEIHKNDTLSYFPFSFDGGYRYEFKLK